MIADGIALEQTVLGHALNDSQCYQLFVGSTNWDDFSAANHKVLAFCLKHLAKLGVKKPDEDSLQLVINAYPGQDEKDYGGAEYIRSLKQAFQEPTENYQQFVDRLKLYAAKMRIGGIRAQQLVKLSNDPKTTVSDLRDVVKQLNVDLELAGSDGYNFKHMDQLGGQYLAHLKDRAERTFYTTGLPELDGHLTQGFAPKLITVMAGFTGMAKSTVAINMAHRMAVKGIVTALFAMESTDISMLDKIVSTLTRIQLVKLKKDAINLSANELQSIRGAIEHVKKLPLIINDQSSISVDGIMNQLLMATRRGMKPDVVFIDLFGKVEDVDTGDNLAAKIQREVKRMRVLAKELDTHFVLVVQVGRQGYGKGKKDGKIRRPTLIDVKNSNAFAEEADIVLLLHRTKYYMPDLEDDLLEINIAKQRDGEANTTVCFEIDPSTSSIMSTAKKPVA